MLHKIKNKITLAIVITSIFLSSTIFLFNIRYTNSLVQSEAEKKLEYSLKNISENLNAKLAEKENAINFLDSYIENQIDYEQLINNETYFNNFNKDLDKIIYQLALSFSDAYICYNPSVFNHTYNIWYFDENKDGLLELMPILDISYFDNDIINKSWFYKPILEQKETWIDPYKSSTLNQNFITYTKPLIYNGTSIGVIGIDFLFEDMKDLILDYNIYKTGRAFLLNSEFKILVDNTYKEGLYLDQIYNNYYLPLSLELEKENSGIKRFTDYDGSDKILIFSKLKNNWLIAISVDNDEIFFDLKNHNKKMLIITLLGICLSAILAYLFGSKLSKPIEYLISQIQLIGYGNYDNPIDDKYKKNNNEIGDLAKSIDSTREKQNQFIKTIKNQNRYLDKKIMERTKELQIKNNELENSIEKLHETTDLLVESKKMESITNLMQGLSHRLNTPLGTCITTSSYLSRLLTSLSKNLKINNFYTLEISSIHNNLEEVNSILNDNLMNIKLLMDNFNQLSEEYHVHDKCDFLVHSHIKTTLNNILTILSMHNKISYKLTIDDELRINNYPDVFSKLLYNLIKTTIEDVSISTQNQHINISAKSLNNGIIMTYSFKSLQINEDNIDNIFDPYFINKFKNIKTGLELHLAYNIVIKGLNGNIKSYYNDSYLNFDIYIPNIN